MTATTQKPERDAHHCDALPHELPSSECLERANNRFPNIVSRSPAMEGVFDKIENAAPVDCTVLITGESGTGKELIAEAIHKHSCRRKGPYVTVNMAAVPESLVESELFGHVKGSFTGAASNRKGRFEAANGGTLFIDEIGDLKQASQAKLLRALENRVVTPVGGNDNREVDVRIVAATNRNLEQMVADGDFRDDLYYRLNIVRMSLPPLRDRPEDIGLLVRFFVNYFCQEYDRPALRIDRELVDFLQDYEWPGNVRELRNCVESMVVLSKADRLTLDDLPAVTRDATNCQKKIQLEIPDNVTLAEVEETVIKQVLDRCDGNRTRAADQLEISVRTLQRRLARWETAN
jgi:transcriptional regulator with PAS, ATPase and Fis domain